MKTATQWLLETNSFESQFRDKEFCMKWTELFEAIQKDAYTNPPTYGELHGIPPTFPPEPTDEEAIHELNRIIEDLQFRFAIKDHEFLLMRQKWRDTRKHLRAANKGAERNAIALQLAASRINSMNDPIKAKLWEWLAISNDEMRLRMGEISAQEIRNIRACLRAILGTKDLSPKTNQ